MRYEPYYDRCTSGAEEKCQKTAGRRIQELIQKMKGNTMTRKIWESMADNMSPETLMHALEDSMQAYTHIRGSRLQEIDDTFKKNTPSRLAPLITQECSEDLKAAKIYLKTRRTSTIQGFPKINNVLASAAPKKMGKEKAHRRKQALDNTAWPPHRAALFGHGMRYIYGQEVLVRQALNVYK
ncbi:hypothetical protein [Dubosiella newyorkensis]|uniref:hypothetical protein n=1 Tax=Dubosiella newyorkensis TaxID=1862672 RepID=UPI003F66D5EC